MSKTLIVQESIVKTIKNKRAETPLGFAIAFFEANQ